MELIEAFKSDYLPHDAKSERLQEAIAISIHIQSWFPRDILRRHALLTNYANIIGNLRIETSDIESNKTGFVLRPSQIP